MGNPPLKTKPKPKTQANQALPGSEIPGSDVAAQPATKLIKVRLVQIQPSVFEQVSLQAGVIIKWMDNGYGCVFNNEILGRIPPNYNKQLDEAKIYIGNVVELKQVPITVIIEFNIE